MSKKYPNIPKTMHVILRYTANGRQPAIAATFTTLRVAKSWKARQEVKEGTFHCNWQYRYLIVTYVRGRMRQLSLPTIAAPTRTAETLGPEDSKDIANGREGPQQLALRGGAT